MSTGDVLSAARRRANELLNRKETERLSALDKEREARDAKIARLRALRLAKEASDKAASLARTSPLRRKPA
jgi:hypothetical protein